MENYFNKYLKSKLCLYKMVSQFITTYISIEEAKQRQLDICNDTFRLDNYLEVCFHNFKSEGILAWKYLNLNKDYITHEEIWNLQLELKNTKFDSNVDYYEEYLKICILLIDMTKKYYGHTISLDDVLKDNIKYNDIDELNNHYCEGAGESVWSLFDIDDAVIGESIFDKIRIKCVSELIENKEKILVKKINR